MGRKYTALQLRQENLAYAGTGGISENCRSQRFQAAFQDLESGRIELARFENGQPAPMHIFSGLPDVWVVRRDGDGQPLALLDSIEAGFVRDGVFYTREQAAALV